MFCSGKVYFDLLESRRAENVQDVAIVRIEQLYPFPIDEYAAVLGRYRNASEIVWCQEEPQNQGAWYQIRHRLQEPLSSQQRGALRGPARRGGAGDRASTRCTCVSSKRSSRPRYRRRAASARRCRRVGKRA